MRFGSYVAGLTGDGTLDELALLNFSAYWCWCGTIIYMIFVAYTHRGLHALSNLHLWFGAFASEWAMWQAGRVVLSQQVRLAENARCDA